MIYNTRNEFFNALSSLTINEIRDRVLLDTQNSVERYNELLNDYRGFINNLTFIDHYAPTTESKKEFTNHRAEGLTPATPERISWYAADFSLGTYGVAFDFITIEPNCIKQVHLKVSCSLAEEEPFANYVVGGFMFTEACKMVIAKLLEQPQQPKTPEAVKPKKPKKTLFEFIHNIKDKEAFTSELKDLFPTEIGKSIKAIIDILSKEQFLIYGTKEFKQLFEELKNCFSRDIGSYNSVQNVKTVDAETTDIILKKLNPLIIKYKTT